MGDRERQALTGVDIGQVLSFESCATGVPTVSLFAEGNTGSGIMASGCPHGVRDPGHVSLYFMQGTWEVPVASGGLVTLRAAGEGEEPNGLHARCREVGQTRRSEEADEQR